MLMRDRDDVFGICYAYFEGGERYMAFTSLRGFEILKVVLSFKVLCRLQKREGKK